MGPGRGCPGTPTPTTGADTLGLRPANQVTDSAGATRTESYGYDDLSRLASVNYGHGQTQSYGFDPLGKRLSRQDSAARTTNYAYDAANRLTGAGGQSYTSDADGNTITGGGRTCTWDSQNRLVQCVSGSNTSSFTYGADGLRRRSTVNGVTTDYALDGQSAVRELRGAVGP